MGQVLSLMRTPLSRNVAYAGLWVLLARTVYRASIDIKKSQTMITVGSSIVPSEFSVALLSLFVLWNVWRAQRPPVPPPAVPHDRESSRTSFVISKSLFLARLFAIVATVASLAKMAWYNLRAAGHLRNTLDAAGLKTLHLDARSPLTGIVGNFVPTPRLLAKETECTSSVTFSSLPLPMKPAPVKQNPSVIASLDTRFKTIDLKLDVYRPASATSATPAPMFLYFHGGGWVAGDRRAHSIPLLYQAAAAGWVVISASYRLAPAARFPHNIIDCKRAIIWAKAHAAEYGGNASLLVVGGESAGGHLSSLAALTPNFPLFQPPEAKDADTSVQGCVDLYGVHDFTDSLQHYYRRDNGGFRRFLQSYVMPRRQNGELARLSDSAYMLASPLFYLRTWAQACVTSSSQPRLLPGAVRPREAPGSALLKNVTVAAPSTPPRVDAPSPLEPVVFDYDAELPRILELPPPCPFLVLTAELDTLVPASDGRNFFQVLQRSRGLFPDTPKQAKDLYVELPNTHHGFNIFMSPRTVAMGDCVCDFLKSILDHSASGVTATDAVPETASMRPVLRHSKL